MSVDETGPQGPTGARYILDDQVGFVLRQVAQRHTSIFAERFANDVTTTQWAALSKLREVGPTSQNLLGRLTAMDVATIKGVVDRLQRRGLLHTIPDTEDARRHLVCLTPEGTKFVDGAAALALEITDETLAPLDARERRTLMALLTKLK